MTASLLENSNALGLCFNTPKDAIDFATKCAEDSKHWLAVHNLDFIKSYKDMEIEIVFVLRSGAKSDEHHLVFRSIPNVRSGHFKETCATNANTSVDNSSSNRDQHFVFVGISHFIQGPEEIIPSQVRLEPAKKRLDLLRDIFGSSDRTCHVSNTLGEGKGGVLGIFNSRCNRDRIPSDIESTSKILHKVCGDIGDGRWEGLSQPDLMNYMASLIRVRLSNLFVWIDLLELDNFPFKISEVFLSPCEFTF